MGGGFEEGAGGQQPLSTRTIACRGGRRVPRRPPNVWGYRGPFGAPMSSDLDLAARERALPDAFVVVGEEQIDIARYGRPCAAPNLVLELTRRPAGIAEDEETAARPRSTCECVQHLRRDGQGDAVGYALAGGDHPVGGVQDEPATWLHWTTIVN